MKIVEVIKSNEKLKQLVHWLMIPKYQARPRLWVKLFLNPFFHKYGKNSLVRSRTRMDLLPFNLFSLGSYSTIEDFSTVNNGVGAVIIGDRVRIGIGNIIIGPVTIENDVILAQNIVCSGLNHGYEDVSIPIHLQPVTTKSIIIKKGCWIGANVVITAGVTVGEHSVVAGGSVVTKDVPSYSVVGGNPARPLKRYNEESKKWEKV